MDAPAPLEIHLLGGFRVAVHGRLVPSDAWRQRRAAAVVKLLALAPAHRLHREQVIEALWPELDGEAAANNLRVAMHRARSRLEEAGAPRGRFLVRDGEDVALAAADAVWIDVDAYEAAVARAWLTEDPATSRKALDLYAGDLLPEDLYEDWAANRRAELRASHLTLLARLAQLHEQHGELGRAIATLQRLLAAEPLDEQAHLTLIRLFARAGETRQAVTQYERLTELLERELGTEPDEETRELIAAIHAGRFATEAEPFAPLAPEPPPAPTAPPAAAPVSGLPAPMEGLIGRDREIAEVQRLLASHRLVTLTGPAGVGKTRLALAVAHEVATERHGGAWFVDLSTLRDPELVLPAIAHGIGVREEGERSLREGVIARLGDAPALLVLDNFEQVLAAAPVVADLLATSAGLRVLVTSRVRLRLRGEQEYPVHPLRVGGRESEVGGDGKSAVTSGIHPSPAVQLFIARAQEVDPSFTLDGDAQAVATICRRLDGLPLAIELAAARVRVFSPSALLPRLERPLALLTGGPRDAPERQQTLRAAITWSHDLLSAAEQTLFARLAVFRGGLTLEAAEYVGEERGTPSSVLDLVASLAEQSLLRRVGDTATEPRFGMLETIREYAAERLDASGEREVLEARHAAYFLELAERAEPELTGPAAAEWLEAFERERDNLRVALANLAARGEAEARLRLAGALWRFWWLRGYLSEGRAELERALAGEGGPLDARAKALDGAGALAAAQGDLNRATMLHAEALRLWREIGDRRGMVAALTNLGLLADERGDPRQATTYLQEALLLARADDDRRGLAVALLGLGQVAMTLEEHQRAASLLGESVALFRELGDARSQAAILANLGLLAFSTGDFGGAKTCHEEALALLVGLGDRQGAANVLLNLGEAVQRMGDLDRAGRLFAEAYDRYQEIGDRSGVAFAQNNLGRVAHLRGNAADAESLLGQGLALGQIIGDPIAIVEALEGLVAVACATKNTSRAAKLIGAAEALRMARGVPRPDVHHADFQRCVLEARQALGELNFGELRLEGQTLMLEQIDAPPKLFSGLFE